MSIIKNKIDEIKTKNNTDEIKYYIHFLTKLLTYESESPRLFDTNRFFKTLENETNSTLDIAVKNNMRDMIKYFMTNSKDKTNEVNDSITLLKSIKEQTESKNVINTETPNKSTNLEDIIKIICNYEVENLKNIINLCEKRITEPNTNMTNLKNKLNISDEIFKQIRTAGVLYANGDIDKLNIFYKTLVSGLRDCLKEKESSEQPPQYKPKKDTTGESAALVTALAAASQQKPKEEEEEIPDEIPEKEEDTRGESTALVTALAAASQQKQEEKEEEKEEEKKEEEEEEQQKTESKDDKTSAALVTALAAASQQKQEEKEEEKKEDGEEEQQKTESKDDISAALITALVAALQQKPKEEKEEDESKKDTTSAALVTALAAAQQKQEEGKKEEEEEKPKDTTGESVALVTALAAAQQKNEAEEEAEEEEEEDDKSAAALVTALVASLQQKPKEEENDTTSAALVTALAAALQQKPKEEKDTISAALVTALAAAQEVEDDLSLYDIVFGCILGPNGLVLNTDNAQNIKDKNKYSDKYKSKITEKKIINDYNVTNPNKEILKFGFVSNVLTTDKLEIKIEQIKQTMKYSGEIGIIINDIIIRILEIWNINLQYYNDSDNNNNKNLYSTLSIAIQLIYKKLAKLKPNIDETGM